MVVVKYFFEEPASLEIVAPDTHPDGRAPATPRSLESFLNAPRYYRGYLAATDLEADLTGATAAPAAWAAPLASVCEGGAVRSRAGKTSSIQLVEALAQGLPGDAICVGRDAPDVLPDLSGEVRDRLPGLRTLLDRDLAVFLAEPAHHGVDWAVFSSRPLADRVREAFSAAEPGPARFVIPHVKARGEHKFYFERYDLGLFEAFRVP